MYNISIFIEADSVGLHKEKGENVYEEQEKTDPFPALSALDAGFCAYAGDGSNQGESIHQAEYQEDLTGGWQDHNPDCPRDRQAPAG